jgi:hypothetical protein
MAGMGVVNVMDANQLLLLAIDQDHIQLLLPSNTKQQTSEVTIS